MLSRIHQKLGTAGFIIAIAALVAALAGGAYAAAQPGLTGKQKKQVKSIAKSEAKKYANSNPGAPGKDGAPGAQGPTGPQGPEGPEGLEGLEGESVDVNPIATELEACEGRGGAEVIEEEAAEGVDVCNGEEGSPWTVGGVLPSGKTETGAWVAAAAGIGSVGRASISFTLPLAIAPTPIFVEGTSAAGCPGVIGGVPTADPGKLCLYVGLKLGGVSEEEGEKFILFTKPEPPGSDLGASKAGSIFQFGCASAQCTWTGTWAVKA